MHLCGIDYKYFSPHCCKCNSLDCIAAIRFGSACHGPHSDSVYSGSEYNQFDSLRLVKREAGFPNLWWVLIGSNQLWCVNDLSYYRELSRTPPKVYLSNKWIYQIQSESNQNQQPHFTSTIAELYVIQEPPLGWWLLMAWLITMEAPQPQSSLTLISSKGLALIRGGTRSNNNTGIQGPISI